MYETVNLPSGLISCDLLNTEFLLQFLRQRIFVYHHADCFSTYIAFRHIQITSGFVAFRSPGILGDIIFSTILIFHNAGDVHQVVVSCHKLLVTILTDFRCYVDFRIRMLKLEHFVHSLIFWHFLKTGTVGSRVIFHILHLRIDGDSVLERETLFAYVTVLTYGISFVQCIVDSLDQFVQRKIIHRLVFPVVGNFR